MKSFDELRKEAKKNRQTSIYDPSYSGTPSFEKIRAEIEREGIISAVNDATTNINSLASGYNSRFFDEEGKYISKYRDDSEAYYNSVSSSQKNILNSLDDISSRTEKYSSYYDKAFLKEINDFISGNKNAVSNLYNAAESSYKEMSKYKDEDAYKQAVAAYEAQQKKLGEDTGVLKTELYSLEKLIKKIDDLPYTSRSSETTQSSQNGGKFANATKQNNQYTGIIGEAKEVNEGFKKAEENRDKNVAELSKEYGYDFATYDELKAAYNEKRTYLYETERLQKLDNLEKFAVADADFSKYVEIGSKTDVSEREIEHWHAQNFDGELLYMTSEEESIYNYYYGKFGKEKAEEYYDSLLDRLTQRKAGKIAEEKNTWIEKQLFAVEAGFDQFFSGMGALFDGSDYIQPTATQYASGIIRESFDDGFSKGLYDLTSTTTNMLPSILAGTVVSAIASPAAGVAVGGKIGMASGALTLGASAAGHAKAEMINLGYSEQEAWTYAGLIGASEACLEYLLGGISKLGGAVSGNVVSKTATSLASGMDNAVGRFFLKYGTKYAGEMLSEGVEESLQEILSPAFRSAITYEDYKVNWGDVVYSGLLGALSAGVLNGAGAVGSSAKAVSNAVSLKKSGEVASVAEGIKATYAADSIAGQIAGEVTDSTSAFKIAMMLHDASATLTESNQADIAHELETKHHMAKKDAESIAKNLAKVVEGGIANKQVKDLLGDETNPISDTLRSFLYSNSTVNQRLSAVVKAQGRDITAGIDPDSVTSGTDTASISNSMMFKEAYKEYTENAEKSELQNKLSERLSSLQEQIDSETNYEARKELQKQYDDLLQTAKSLGYRTTASDYISSHPVMNKTAIDIMESAKKTAISNAHNRIASVTDKVSSEGKTFNKQTGEEIGIKKFVSVGKDEIIYETNDGKKVSSKDVEYSSSDEAALYESMRTMGYDAETANALLQARKTSDLSTRDFLLATAQGYQYGYSNTAENLRTGKDFASLPKSLKDYVLDVGAKARARHTETLAERSKTAPKKVIRSGKVTLIDDTISGINASSLTNQQRVGIKTAEILAGIAHNEVHIYESVIATEGKHKGKRVYSKDVGGKKAGELAANGFYNTSEGVMYIDINAGAGATTGTMLYTLAHEYTHFIRDWSPEKFDILADFVMKEYGKNNREVEAAIKNRMVRQKLSYDIALEEMVADSMERMLTDTNAVEKIAQLQSADKTLWDKLGSFIRKLTKGVRKVYKDSAPNSYEAREWMKTQESLDKLSSLWAEAFVEASENFASDSDIVDINTESESVSPMHSERTWTSSEYVLERDKTAEKISKALGVTKAKALSYIDNINSIAKMIADDRVRLDYEASSFGSAFVSNVEYGGSFDYTTLCKKRRIYTGTFTEIQKRLKDVALTPDDILTIRNLMIEEGIEATCGLCYVEGSRANMGKFAKEFIRLYKRDNPQAWIPNMADVNTPDGVEQMRISHPEAYEQYVYFWNHYGKLKDSDPALFASQQKPKLYEARKEYKGEILEHFKGDTAVEKKNLNGGIRMQSFSDFEIVHLIDTMQVIMDMSTVGLAGQAYTKVPEFAKAFGNTGLKINLSLIAKGVDADGNLIFDDREGMPHTTAFELRDRYSKNVGTIIVTFTDEQLRAAMSDPRIDFIIPFHRSQWKKGQYSAMGLPKGTKDYTYMQNEKLIKKTYHEYRGRMVADKASNYMPNEYWDFSKTGKENAEIYLKMCAENNKRPKFYKLLDFDGKGTYSLKKDGSTDGYWKLLVDFKMYDNDGLGSPQTAVTPTFNMDEAKTMLDEYQGGHTRYPVANSVVDTFVEKYNEEHKTRYQQRDSYAPTFYSHMGKVVDGIKSDKVGASSVVSYLKGKGVKNEEIKWSGIETWLEGKKSVTKTELQEFIAGSMLQIEEQVRDEKTGNNVVLKKMSKDKKGLYVDGSLVETFTKDEDGRLVPDSDPTNWYGSESWIIEEYEDLHGKTYKHSDHKLKGGKNYREILFKLPNTTYTNGAMKVHWGENANGILAHARVQDFKVNGNKMLFIEEIQSDWHNEGHREGYVPKGEATVSDIRNKSADSYRSFNQSNVMQSVKNRLARSEYDGNVTQLVSDLFDGNKSAYSDVAYYANLTAEEKAFIDKTIAEERKRQADIVNAHSGKGVPDAPFRDNYHEFVLKKLIRDASENGYDSIGWTTADIQSERWSEDFAEGYRIEYDQDIPKFLRKYGKKWGAEVGKTTIHGNEVWSMDIPSSMKDSVLYEGQTLYQQRDSAGNTLSKEQQEYFKDSKVRDENGNLRVVYHGTPNGSFTQFKISEGSHSSLMAAYGAGFYFDTDRASAQRYTSAVNKTVSVSNPKVYETYLNITNPLEITESSHVITKEQFAEVISRGNYEWFFTDGMAFDLRKYLNKSKSEIQQMPRDEVVSHWADMMYERAYNDSDILSAMVKAYRGSTILEAMKDTFGKDGIRVNDKYGEMWIAWDSSQIKDTSNVSPTSDPDLRYQLRDVDPVQPTSDKWERTLTTSEVKAKFPDLWDISADESEARNPTQISGTVKSYRKVYDFLKAEGFDGTILDASSGLGYGTRAGIEEYGFEVDDIEPYPDKNYNPKYKDYSKLDEKYDVIISNAVLNVIPQDQRDALVVKMGELLKDGGRMFINVRGDDVRNASSKVAINEDLMEYYISQSGSYQKGFTKSELVAYLQDALGEGFTVKPISWFGKTSAIVTKDNADIRYQDRVSEDAKVFAHDINQWNKDGRPDGETFILGSTGDVLQGLGAIESDIYMLGDKVKEILSDHPEITLEEIKKIPQLLENPVLILKSKNIGRNSKQNTRMVIFGSVKAKNGNPILTVLDLRPVEKSLVIDDMQKVSSAYTKTVNPVNFVLQSDVLYADKNKTTKLLRTIGFKMPIELQLGGYVGSISYNGQNVNIKGETFSNVFKENFSEQLEQQRGEIDNRTLLANALESTVKNPVDAQYLADYRKRLADLNEKEIELAKVKSEIKNISFTKGSDRSKLVELNARKTFLQDYVTRNDKKLLKMESTTVLQRVLDAEKKKAYKKAEQKGKEAIEAYRERAIQKQDAIVAKFRDQKVRDAERRTKTEMRHKIRKVVSELNTYLLNGNKKKHVTIELQKSVAEALALVDMDSYGATERIAKYDAWIAKETDPEKIAELTATRDRIAQRGENVSAKLDSLKSAYDKIINSDDPMIAQSHDPVISNRIAHVSESIKDTPLWDMNLSQLEDVYELYKMVLTSIRDANKSFISKKREEIAVRAGRVMTEVYRVGGKKSERLSITAPLRQFNWNLFKPNQAFKVIGSETFKEAFDNIRAGEDAWAVDIGEARSYFRDVAEKYGYDSWDTNKRYKFTSSSGMDFELNLDQIMSLYAYSKREQADAHLRIGGIVFDESTKIVKKTKLGFSLNWDATEATAYNISTDTLLRKIIPTLTREQMAFVDEMQKYLSDDMAEKGNEVSLALYGVKLFKDKNYFPLKSAPDFMAKAKEQQMGDVKVKNKGFTKETVPNASNPIVLQGFMDVWANHVDEMSLYHAMTLPLEDFYRIYNYKTRGDEDIATESVAMTIRNAYSKEAIGYIDQLLKDVNGGARSDPTAGIINKFTGLFKKSAVFASLSVIVQQPTAIARAAAMIDAKYFVKGAKFDKHNHKKKWEEVKKYAPVAVIKEMGYFDTHVGKSTVDYLIGKEYNTFKEKAKGFVDIHDSNYRDEVFSRGAAKADELAWCYLWDTVKREIADTTTLAVGSEAFLKKCGERFTDVVINTQVYDSVMARSGVMRSKDTGMKMVTAFMAEPLTQFNMLMDAVVQGKRGNKKYSGRVVGAVVASAIFNAALRSLVYASRDDDKDETYWEKYLAEFASGTIESLNPFGLIPWVKDIVSLLQGYDIERADMSSIADLINAFRQLGSDTKSPYRKVEDFAGAIATFLGLPLKNLMRDVRGIWNFATGIPEWSNTSADGILDTLKEEFTGKEEPKYADFADAVKTGKNLKATINKYLDDGVSPQTLASQITSNFKSEYIAMSNVERAKLKGYLLNAYEILGYDRAKKSKDIDKWVEEE